MNETVLTTIMITGFGIAFFMRRSRRTGSDRFQIHHRTLQFETPDHECSLAPEEKV